MLRGCIVGLNGDLCLKVVGRVADGRVLPMAVYDSDKIVFEGSRAVS